MGKYFTTKDIDKIRNKLKKAGAIPLKAGDMVEIDVRTYKTLIELDKWSTKVLRQSIAENN